MSTDDFPQRVLAATKLLEAVLEDRGRLTEIDPELRQRFLTASGRVSAPSRAARKEFSRSRRKKRSDDTRTADRKLLATPEIRKLRENPIFHTPRRSATPPAPPPSVGSVDTDRVCYTCQARYKQIHGFYDQLCPPCGDFNFAKRTPSADLSGRVAIVTGSRVKIGYQAAITLLRSGCHVVCTTRFPQDAARRYAAEPDFAEWGDRLEIHGIDLRHVPNVEALCAQLNDTLPRLDFLINNACQTVRRPAGFYDHLMALEQSSQPTPARIASTTDAWRQVGLVPVDGDRAALFPEGALDQDQQQIDLRRVNSWRLRLGEVGAIELLEVHLVNAVAPFLLNARLKPLMLRVPTEDKHIVNVSAVEGQFYRTFKTDRHPHTNMAKAALNMMTRTAAVDYVADGIHMNSVDTGWVTDEDPAHHAARKRAEHNFHPPLDIVDGAARIVDPIFSGLETGTHVWGQFLKNYRATDW